MAKKKKNFSAEQIGTPSSTSAVATTDTFYFSKENYKWMLIGLALIILGFVLMLGPDANTVNGKYDPNSWNEGIFSTVRIRIAPLLVILGFGLEAFAIIKRNK